jgi:hypothetical protein
MDVYVGYPIDWRAELVYVAAVNWSENKADDGCFSYKQESPMTAAHENYETAMVDLHTKI